MEHGTKSDKTYLEFCKIACDNVEYGSSFHTSMGSKRNIQLPILVWEAEYFIATHTGMGSI